MKLFYEEMGQGQPVILIHGYPFNHTIFFRAAEEMKPAARIILPDLRGFGRSPGGEVSLVSMADDLLELMDTLKIKKAVLGGHSMGGYLGVHFSHRHPERVAGLALIASHAAADTEEQRQGRIKNIEKIRSGQAKEYLLESMAPKLTKYPEIEKILGTMMVKTPDETLTGALQSMADRPDRTEWLRQSRLPVAMIYGEEDMIMPAARAREMAAKLAADPVVGVSAAGHMLMLENPRMLADGLLEFMQRFQAKG